MSDIPSIDAWLDLWEDRRERGETPDEKSFIARHCRDAPPELVEEFRRKLRRLQRMDARVEQAAADTATGAADADTKGGPKPAAPKVLQPGFEPVPGYVLVAKLGSGGFGQVWKAAGPGGHEVALKFVRLEKRVGDAERRALDVMRHVRHPHLLSCHGSWQVGRWLVVAMDLADRTLLDRFREATSQGHAGIPGDELLGYLEEAAKGIDFLNEPRHGGPRPGDDGGTPAGIQHRDIKPQNLLLQGGGVKVADFGLAKFLEHSVTGHTGSMTPAYSAPESFGSQTSSRSDQYSLAVTYCHLRGGRLPFTGSPLEVMLGHRERPPDLSMLPPAERPAVARALAKSPADRWPSCREFAAALRAAAGGGHGAARIVWPRWASAKVVGPAAGAVAVLAGAAILLSITGRDAGPAKDASVAAADAATGSPPAAPERAVTSAEPAGDAETRDGASADATSVPPATPTAGSTTAAPGPAADESKPAPVAETPPAPTETSASTPETSASKPEPPVPAADIRGGPEPSPAPDFVPLFNGRDLSGWKQFRTTDRGGSTSPRQESTSGDWEVVGDTVTCVAGAGRRGYLRTDRAYSDFVLRLEFRIAEGGNSGVLIRLPGDGGSVSEAGMEVQILDDHAPGRRTPAGLGQTGAIWKATGPVPRVLRPGGAWNEMEVRCEGDRVRIAVNGTTTTDVRTGDVPELRGRPRSGYIGLMTEGATAEGPWFRNVEILDSAAPRPDASTRPPSPPDERRDLAFTPLFNGTDLAGWTQLRAVVPPGPARPGERVAYRFEPTRGAWEARSGQLVCVSRGENAQGLIRTGRRYGDFVLRLEFRVPDGCNSKVYVRLPDVSIGRADDEGVAVQIADDAGRGIEDAASRTGAVYGVAGPDRTLARPDGEWNRLEVRCEGDRVRVTLNGVPAADVDMAAEPTLRGRPRSGYVGFACYGAAVDGPWFRDVEIAELDAD